MFILLWIFFYIFFIVWQPLVVSAALPRTTSRSSRPEVFCKKGVHENFTKLTGKHLCQSLFFSKVAGLRPAILLKKRLWHRCFPVNFAKFLRVPFFIEHLCWLLLYWVENLHLSFGVSIEKAPMNLNGT